MAIVTNMTSFQSFRTWIGYQIEETHSRVAKNSFQGSLQDTVYVSLINAVVAKIITNFLRHRYLFLTWTLCRIVTFLIVVKIGDMTQVIASLIGSAKHVGSMVIGGWEGTRIVSSPLVFTLDMLNRNYEARVLFLHSYCGIAKNMDAKNVRACTKLFRSAHIENPKWRRPGAWAR